MILGLLDVRLRVVVLLHGIAVLVRLLSFFSISFFPKFIADIFSQTGTAVILRESFRLAS